MPVYAVFRRPALILMALGLIGCESEVDTGSPAAPRVAAVEVTQVLVSQDLSVFGTVTHRSKADVYPRSEGRVVELFAEEGDRIASGSPLAQLETGHLELSLAEAQAEVESKEALLRLAREKLAEGRRSVEAQFLGIEKMEQEVAQRQLETRSLREALANRERLFAVGGVPEGELEALRTQYEGAETSLLQARKDLEIARIGFREEDLLEAGFGVPPSEARWEALFVELNVRRLAAEVQVAESELRAAVAERSRVELLVEESLTRAPIAGIVGRRYLDLGEKATPDTLLYTIFDTATVYVEVHIPEDELPRVRRGQAAELLLEQGDEGRSFDGRVFLITPFVDPQSRAARVRILLENADGVLVPGMFLRGSIEVGPPRQELTLPVSAVALDGPEGNEVLLIRNGSVFRRVIDTGETAGGRIVIAGGLEAGDLVAADVSRSLPDGTRVEVVE